MSTSAKKQILLDIAQTLADAVTENRDATVLVRCDDENAREEAEAAIVRFSRHVRWEVLTLNDSDDPLDVLRDAQRSRRVFCLVKVLSEGAAQHLSVNRGEYRRHNLRAVFLFTRAESRRLAEAAPDLFSRRDKSVSWTSNSSTTQPSEEAGSANDAPIPGTEQWGPIRARLHDALKRPKSPERGGVIFRACRDAFLVGDLESAEKVLSAIQELKSEGHTEEVAEALQILGAVAEHRGDRRAAEDWYNESLQQWKTTSSKRGLASINGKLGSLRFQDGDYDAAEKLLEIALQLERVVGDPIRICDASRHFAMLLERCNKLQEAENMLEEAEKLAKTAGDNQRMARVLHHRARLMERKQQWVEARDLYNHSLMIKEAANDLPGVAATLHQLGNVHFFRAEYDTAIDCYLRSVELEAYLKDDRGLAASLMQLAHVAEERYQYDLAYKSLIQARPILKKLRSPLTDEAEKRIERMQTTMLPESIVKLKAEAEKEAVEGYLVPAARIKKDKQQAAAAKAAEQAATKPALDLTFPSPPSGTTSPKPTTPPPPVVPPSAPSRSPSANEDSELDEMLEGFAVFELEP
ncbi:MAG: tetratricopeptide repeat protein [Myxococcales bacterium]|nr:tetratricopeptide repeat protein [Myxococcales bacterium]